MDPQNQPSPQPGIPGQAPDYGALPEQTSWQQPAGQTMPVPQPRPMQPPVQQIQSQPQQPQPEFQQSIAPQQPPFPQQQAQFSQQAPAGMPMQTMQQAVMTSNPVNTTMRNKILKIIAGLTVFSLLGVGLIFFFGNSPDGSLQNLVTDSNDLASYQVPEGWISETSVDSVDYFNGDTLPASSAVVSVINPQRIKYSGEPLTDNEIKTVLNEMGNLESRDLGGGIEVLSSQDIEVDGFEHAVEYEYIATATDNQTKINGKFRIYFDKNAYLHGFEVAAVKSYWSVNQEALSAILDTYTLN